MRKTVQVHRFVYECYHGIIPDGLVIDHINDDRIDNRLCNLQLLTPQETSIKAAKNRGKRSPPRPVVAINLTTGDRHYFPSMSCAGKELGFHSARVQDICVNSWQLNKKLRFRIRGISLWWGNLPVHIIFHFNLIIYCHINVSSWGKPP